VADFFREIDEELRAERLQKLWQKHGKLLIALAAAIVVGTAAYVAWRHYDTNHRLALAEEYGAAVALADPQTGDLAKADAALARIADKGGGYGALADLQRAAVKAKAGDLKGAVQIYDALAADQNAPANLRDLARLLKAMRLIDTGDPAEIKAVLEPLTASDSPWRYSAMELNGLLALKTGDPAKAATLFTQLADDQAAPTSLRARAAEMAAALKG
jgi:hypothetical protein